MKKVENKNNNKINVQSNKVLEKNLCFQNREISWLKFNERVLDEANSGNVPIFERLKFISIFSSNLDEFFMVRVAKLLNCLNHNLKYNNLKNNNKIYVLLRMIFYLVRILLNKQTKIYGKIEKKLSSFNLNHVSFKQLSLKQKFELTNLALKFKKVVLNKNSNFFQFKNRQCYFVLELQNKLNGKIEIVFFDLNDLDYKFLIFYKNKKINYILIEDCLLNFLPYDKEKYRLLSEFKFKIARSVELNYSLRESLKFLKKVDYIDFYLKKVNSLDVVGFFYFGKPSKQVLNFFQEGFKIKKSQMFEVKVPLNMDYVFDLQNYLTKNQHKKLCYKPLFEHFDGEKIKLNNLTNKSGVYFKVFNKDILLYFPYEPVEEFLKFLNEAAFDENVTTIKIIIYRAANESVLVEILKIAAKKGKNVVVVVELFARFDEQQNLELSVDLKRAGCSVFFGFKSVKIHSKICVIVKKIKNKETILTQIGTGNYNEKTSRQYSDLSFFTSNKKIGRDALKLFDSIENLNLNVSYSNLIVAPTELKEKIIKLIEDEQKKGKQGRIFMKMNALTDLQIMKKLIDASRSGVKIVLNVRGSCCLIPGIKNFTENIEIFSVVGRYLEHARIYCFGKKLKTIKIFIGSADMMTRNTSKRMEVLVPIFSVELKAKILKIVKILKEDNLKSRYLNKRGELKSNLFKIKRVDSQKLFGKIVEKYEE